MAISVVDNIAKITNSIEEMKNHIKACEADLKNKADEILRLEGCMIVYKGFLDVNIKEIEIPENCKGPYIGGPPPNEHPPHNREHPPHNQEHPPHNQEHPPHNQEHPPHNQEPREDENRAWNGFKHIR